MEFPEGLPFPRYEPLPRFSHCSSSVGARSFIWGGCIEDMSKDRKDRLASIVETFDPYLEVWELYDTAGTPPVNLFGSAVASLLDSLYMYGGKDPDPSSTWLHRLDTTTMEWSRIQPLNPADGPMRKSGCGLFVFDDDTLALFGGSGFRVTQLVQPGAAYVEDARSPGVAWTNEFHLFHLSKGVWSSPRLQGNIPPPSYHFSLTKVDQNRAVLFGGLQQQGKVDHVFIMDLKIKSWTKVNKPAGAAWPAARSCHAACCINYGQEHPKLMISGGIDKEGKTLGDAWLFDVNFKSWKKLDLPEHIPARCGHSLTVCDLGPGVSEVTMFGGCSCWPGTKINRDHYPKLADTTVLRFTMEHVHSGGTSSTEWMLDNVTTSRWLGSAERLRDKIVTAVETAHYHSRRKCEQFWIEKFKDAQLEVESFRRRSFATERELKDLQKRSTGNRFQIDFDMQEQVEMLQKQLTVVLLDAQEKEIETDEWKMKAEVAEQQVKEQEKIVDDTKTKLDAAKRALDASNDTSKSLESDIAALRRRVEEKEFNAAATVQDIQEEFRAKEKSLRVRMDAMEKSALSAMERAHTAERRVQETERSLQAVEKRVELHSQFESTKHTHNDQPFWVIHRDEIELTEHEVGRGGWAVVRVANFRGIPVAAKCLHQVIISEYNRDLFVREMNLASRIRHPNLLQFVGATLDGELIILSELMHTSLRAQVESSPLAIQLVRSIALDVARALNYLHLMWPDPIIHRDISSANVLLEPAPENGWRAKVSDYGSANFYQHLNTAGPGNPVYAAPEANTPNEQSSKMDIFSFGALLIEMYTGRLPDKTSRSRLLLTIQHGWVFQTIWQCIEDNKDKRPTASNLIDTLQRVEL